MTLSEVLGRAALALAAVSAMRLSRQAPAHRALAIALATTFACDVARATLFAFDAWLFVRRFLFLAFPAISAWCVLAVLINTDKRRRTTRASFIGCCLGWLIFVGITLATNPPKGSPIAEQLALSARIAALAVELLVVALFMHRRIRPTFTQTVVLVLVAGDLGELAGPWACPSAWKAWELARVQWGGVYAVVTWLQIRRSKWIQGLAQAQ